EIVLHRAVLVPHLDRARHRRRCRTFLDRTLQDILTHVLRNGPPDGPEGPFGLSLLPAAEPADEVIHELGAYRAPSASFLWDVRDGEVLARLRHPRLRSYVVQYNESDLDFAARLLEEEGISYLFEHAADRVVLRLTDAPGGASLFPDRPS